MNDKSFGGRMLAFLSSLRLAVVTMVTLGSVCGYATFYEMHHGTPAVQRDIYQTPWFAFLLGLLGLNVFSVMVSRYPWTKHHIGFLTAHVGILLVLVGSVVSLYRGLDSNMALFEGETSDRVALLEKALQVSVPGLGGERDVPGRLREDGRRAPGREKRFAVPGSDVVLVADEYQPARLGRRGLRARGRGRPRPPLPPAGADGDAGAVAGGGRPAAQPPRPRHGLVRLPRGVERGAGEGSCSAQPEGANHLSFVAAPDGKLLFAAADASGAREDGRRRAGPAGPDRLAGDGRDGRPLPAAGAPRADGEARDAAGQGGAPPVRGAAPPRGARRGRASPSGCSGASASASPTATSRRASPTARPRRRCPSR